MDKAPPSYGKDCGFGSHLVRLNCTAVTNDAASQSMTESQCSQQSCRGGTARSLTTTLRQATETERSEPMLKNNAQEKNIYKSGR